MIWLFMAVWMTGQEPSDYKMVAKVGPFSTERQCWAAGALGANAIQEKDERSNALGSCKEDEPFSHKIIEPAQLYEFKGMWEMVCLTYGKLESCWLGKDGEFVDPTK